MSSAIIWILLSPFNSSLAQSLHLLGFGNLTEVLTYVTVNGKFPNGTLLDINPIPAENITINTVGQGSSGVWVKNER
jgi:hypothetical protein